MGKLRIYVVINPPPKLLLIRGYYRVLGALREGLLSCTGGAALREGPGYYRVLGALREGLLSCTGGPERGVTNYYRVLGALREGLLITIVYWGP